MGGVCERGVGGVLGDGGVGKKSAPATPGPLSYPSTVDPL